LWSWLQQITVKLVNIQWLDQRRLGDLVVRCGRKNSRRRRGHVTRRRYRRGSTSKRLNRHIRRSVMSIARNGRITKRRKSSSLRRTHSRLKMLFNKRDTSRHNRDYTVVTSKGWQRNSMMATTRNERCWMNVGWGISIKRGKLVIETRPFVKQGKIPREKEYKFWMDSVTRERKEFGGGFPTQLIKKWRMG